MLENWVIIGSDRGFLPILSPTDNGTIRLIGHVSDVTLVVAITDWNFYPGTLSYILQKVTTTHLKMGDP